MSLEWTCEECQEAFPKRRCVVVPEDEDEEVDLDKVISRPNASIDFKKVLRYMYIYRGGKVDET